MPDSPSPSTSRSVGHHTTDGRNIVDTEDNKGRRDIFFAAVQMTRMPMVICDPDRQGFPIIFCNRAFQEMTGYGENEILGRSCAFLQGELTDRETVRRIGNGLREKQDIQEEIYNYRRDGTGFWNALFISPVFDEMGRLIYFFGSQLDVTKRREAEAVLRQSQRMETLGTMASGVAHEFNNLMTVVISSVEQAQAKPSDERQTQQLQRANWAARRAGRLTAQMLSFTRRQFLDERDIDLGDAIREFDVVMAQVAGDRIAIHFDLSHEPVRARADPGQLELALINLVRNAADAMAQGGVITLRTRLPSPGTDGMAELEVHDTGAGMTPDVMARATDPFFSTKPTGQGAGLGLSMVHGFVHQSGGKLVIDSTPGQGTSVRLRFQPA